MTDQPNTPTARRGPAPTAGGSASTPDLHNGLTQAETQAGDPTATSDHSEVETSARVAVEPSPDETNPTTDSDAARGDSESQTKASADQGQSGGSRRTSSLEEVRDGGYSVGSAALIDDGAIPLGHPVKAWESTKTFAAPDHPSYPDMEPELWFTDAGAAQRAGFRPTDDLPQ